MAKALLYELGKSVSFGRLTLLGKVLWPMLLAASDDQGRGLAAPDVIKWTICPNVNELTIDTIPGVLIEMQEQGMVHLYGDVRGRPLYQVVRWWEYQQPQWAHPSRLEAASGWTDRIRFNIKGKEYREENWDQPGGFDGPPPVEDPVVSPDEIQVETQVDVQLNLTESNLNREGADAPPAPDCLPPEKPKQTRTKTPPPPAVQVYRENASRYPPKSWYGRIDAAVGTAERDLKFWGEVVMAYIGCGWNSGNVKTMLEFFERKEIPGSHKDGKGPARLPTSIPVREYT